MPGGFVCSVFIAFVLGVHGWFCLSVLFMLWLSGLLFAEHSRNGSRQAPASGVLVILGGGSRSEPLHPTEKQVEFNGKGCGLVRDGLLLGSG